MTTANRLPTDTAPPLLNQERIAHLVGHGIHVLGDLVQQTETHSTWTNLHPLGCTFLDETEDPWLTQHHPHHRTPQCNSAPAPAGSLPKGAQSTNTLDTTTLKENESLCSAPGTPHPL